MKNITNELSAEHQNILKVIGIVMQECDRLESGAALNKPFFEDIVYFIRNYADGFHHAKEEDILFKAMLGSNGQMHCNPIPVMLHEHDEGRRYVAGMISALGHDQKEVLIDNARGYCYLLHNHILKEDNVLYPMAEEALSEEEKSAVENGYREVTLADFFGRDIETFIAKLNQKKD